MVTNETGSAVRAVNKLAGLVRRCVEDYMMIEDGETIAVGVSGGKDSLSLLCALAELRGYYPKRFALHAVTLDMGFGNSDFSPVERLCEDLGVPYTLRRKEMKQLIFDGGRTKNQCSLCAKMRRGALHDMMSDLGIKKIALAHHHDDAVETFLLSLLYEGRISCFQPVTYMDRADITQIRPMLYAKEESIKKFASVCGLPVVVNPCPIDGATKREEIKVLLGVLEKSYPNLKNKIFGSMQRFPLYGWERDVNKQET